ncbi:MAG: hypothetical protein FJ098_13175, partial [Deltaproteobacteria bacterium]|nr:hypothetical protein [Deltaproteobacteria bacterium]
MDRRWLVSLLAALLADGCSGGPNWIDTDTDGTSGGDDTMVDVWWDDAADAAPGDLAGDQGPPPDGLEDGVLEDGGSDILEDLEGELADVPEDQQEDAAGDGEVEEDVVEPPPPVLPVVTQCPALPVPEDGACAVEPGSIVLVLRGVILAPAEVFVGGEVLISSGGDIACVGCDCSGEPEYAGATRITCPQGIVSPGLINAHDHLTYDGNYPGNWGQERYDHRHDWRCGIRGHQAQDYDKDDQPNHVIWAELRHVLGGATSIAGAGSAPGFLRNLDRENWLEGLDTGAAKNNTFPLGDSGCTLKSEGCDYPSIDPSWVLDNQCYLPHVAEGIDKETRNEFLCLSSTDNGGEDLTEDNSAFIHAVGLIAVDAAELAANGTSVIWSP